MAIDTDNDQGRFLEAVAKLLEYTQKKKITWSVDPFGPEGAFSAAASQEDKSVRKMYTTNYSGRKLRIYEKQVTVQTLKRLPSGARELVKVWRPVLELSEPNGISWWAFPKMDSLADLLRAVEYQISGVDEFVDGLLKGK